MERKVYLMANKVTDEPLQKLLTDMYANPDEYIEHHDEDSIEMYRQAVKDIAILSFPSYIWYEIISPDRVK